MRKSSTKEKDERLFCQLKTHAILNRKFLRIAQPLSNFCRTQMTTMKKGFSRFGEEAGM
jgi:hypothetical protein